jgi:hypothetical protein
MKTRAGYDWPPLWLGTFVVEILNSCVDRKGLLGWFGTGASRGGEERELAADKRR